MTSAINYLSINENFPVAGQDNDTQVFRDNFDTIKTSLRNAKDEISDLQANTARTDLENNFNKNVITNAVMQNVRDQKFDGGAPPSTSMSVDFENGPYQIFRINSDKSIDFVQFPGDPTFTDESSPIGAGKVTLELYGDGTERTITFVTSGSTEIKKNIGSWDYTVTSTIDPIFLEVWRHSNDIIFIRYLGQFS